MRRRAFAGTLAALASVLAGGAAPRADAATTGTISGAIALAGASIAPRVAEIESNLRIVARTGDGTSVGTLRFGAVRDDAAGTSVLTYAIANVPLGVALRVTAEHAPAAVPSPFPSGFFMTFQLHKSGGDPSVPYYPVALDAARPSAGGCDFTYADLEVPPALPHSSP